MSDLELGLSTLLWYDEPELLPHLHLLAEAGIRHLELRRLAPHVDITQPASVRDFTTLRRDLGINLHSVHMPIELVHGMSGLDATVRRQKVAEAKRVAEAVAALDSSMLVTHAGGSLKGGITRADGYKASLESLTEVAAFCERIGLPLALENTLPVEFGIPVEVVAMHDALDLDLVGCCLDTSHANLAVDPVATVELFGKRLLTLHVSDNDGQRDLHALPFEGTVDWPNFMNALRHVQYSGVFMMEVRGGTHPETIIKEAVIRFKRLLISAPQTATLHDVRLG